MNTFFAVAIGGVMLLLIARSLFKVYNAAEMGAKDRRVALAIAVAIFLAFVAMVLILQYARG
jgi:hypothetical protein